MPIVPCSFRDVNDPDEHLAEVEVWNSKFIDLLSKNKKCQVKFLSSNEKTP